MAEFVRRAVPPDHAGAEGLVKNMPNGTFCLLDACGHAPQEDAPERTNARVLEFFAA